MEITEAQIDRWLERGSKFFQATACNPVVRGTLLARGLTDDELAQGWQLYSTLHGFGKQAQALPATRQTAAAQALNAIDAWDAPAYSAAHAVLDVRFPELHRSCSRTCRPMSALLRSRVCSAFSIASAFCATAKPPT